MRTVGRCGPFNGARKTKDNCELHIQLQLVPLFYDNSVRGKKITPVFRAGRGDWPERHSPININGGLVGNLKCTKIRSRL